MAFGYATCMIGFCILIVTNNELWWLAFLIYIASNITFGASFVFYYAWVPILTRCSPKVMASKNKDDIQIYYQVSEDIANSISSKGFAYGYVAAVIELIVALAFVFWFGDGKKYGLTSFYGLQIGIAFSCLWGAIFLYFFVGPMLSSRPGPPIPKGENFIVFSYKKLFGTLKEAR